MVSRRTGFGVFGEAHRPKKTDAQRRAEVKSLKGIHHREGRGFSGPSGLTAAERQSVYGKFGGSDRPAPGVFKHAHGRAPAVSPTAKRAQLDDFLARGEARTGGATPGRPDKPPRAPRKAAKAAAPRKAAKAARAPRTVRGTPAARKAVQARNVRIIPRAAPARGTAPVKSTGRASVRSTAVATRPAAGSAVARRPAAQPQVVQGRVISTRQAATGGAAAGARAGAAGAAAGAAAGTVQARSERKAAKRAARKTGSGPARRLLVAELIVSFLVVGLSPLTDKHKQDPPALMVKRLTAVAALYLILGLVSTGGRGAARVAAAFGGLVTVTLLVSDRDVLSVIAKRFNGPAPVGPAGPDPVEETGNESIPSHELASGNGTDLDTGGGVLAPSSRPIAPGGIAPPGGFA